MTNVRYKEMSWRVRKFHGMLEKGRKKGPSEVIPDPDHFFKL